jgi:hypothetical protein
MCNVCHAVAVRWKDIYGWFLESLSEITSITSSNCVINIIDDDDDDEGHMNLFKKWYLANMPMQEREVRLIFLGK